MVLPPGRQRVDQVEGGVDPVDQALDLGLDGEESEETSTETVVPTAAALTVRLTPEMTLAKVLLAECRVSGPSWTAASAAACTLAPPRRSVPSEAVRVKALAAPVAALDDQALGAVVEADGAGPHPGAAGVEGRDQARQGAVGVSVVALPPTVRVTSLVAPVTWSVARAVVANVERCAAATERTLTSKEPAAVPVPAETETAVLELVALSGLQDEAW